MRDTETKSAAPPAAAGRPDAPRDDEPDRVAARRIAGVWIERLHGYHDHRGSLVPFFDPASPFWEKPVVHGYLITVRPGRIKGWGLHRRQADRYFTLAGELRTVLYDGREDSPTRGNFCEIHFTEGHTGLVLIPPGVWHATQNWGETLGRIVNFPTARFDPRDPDKERIDPHSGKIPFDWSLRDG